jgi:TPR repeat protein
LNNLGLLYVRGTGVPQDYARAAEYFTAAVELGLPTAMTNLGVLYENGYGVELDEERAKALYRAGGRQIEPDAEQQSALIYDARLKPLDLSEQVLKDVQSRASGGDPVAMFQLGWVLLQSPDAPFQNQFQAAALFRAAAEAGYAPAMANLGSLYFQGKGVPQDFVLAQMWILRAAAGGVEQAKNMSDGYIKLMTAAQINEAQARAKVIP